MVFRDVYGPPIDVPLAPQPDPIKLEQEALPDKIKTAKVDPSQLEVSVDHHGNFSR